MRAARREDLLALNLTDRRFGYPLEMVVRAAEAGRRIAETAVPYYPREGKSKVTGTSAAGGPSRTCAGCSPRSRRHRPRQPPAPGPGPARPRPPRRPPRLTAQAPS